MASPSASGVKGAHRQGGDVLIDVALRIDDGRDTALHIGDEIRRVCQTVEIKLFEQQRHRLTAG